MLASSYQGDAIAGVSALNRDSLGTYYTISETVRL